MKHLLIKQAIFLPIIYFGFIKIAGFFANDYSHLGQHASELGINSSKSAVILLKIGILLTSTSALHKLLSRWIVTKPSIPNDSYM